MSHTSQRKFIAEIVGIITLTYLIMLLMVTSGVIHFGLDYLEEDELGSILDVRNWVSMTVTLVIPGALALIIWRYSHHKNEEISEFLEAQHIVLQSEKERINRWKHEWCSLIITELASVNMFYGILEKWLVDYWKNPSDEQRSNLPFAAKRNGDIVKYHFQNISRYVPHIEEHFDDPKLGIGLTNISTSKQFTVIFEVLDQDYCWESNSQGALDAINDKKRIISEMIDKVKKEIPEND